MTIAICQQQKVNLLTYSAKRRMYSNGVECTHHALHSVEIRDWGHQEIEID